MTDTPASCSPADLRAAVAAFQRHAFALLLAGGAPRVADVAEAVSRETLGVAHAVAWLEDHGQLERDGDLLVGAHGLTRRPTPHTLAIGEHSQSTWCAYDAIPVALGATARATTTCPACHSPLVVDIRGGQLPHADTPVLWMPTGPCDRVIDDFCPYANLFCNREHVKHWRRTAGDQDGQVLTLAQVPELARTAWADIATPSGEPSGPCRRFRPSGERTRWCLTQA